MTRRHGARVSVRVLTINPESADLNPTLYVVMHTTLGRRSYGTCDDRSILKTAAIVMSRSLSDGLKCPMILLANYNVSRGKGRI